MVARAAGGRADRRLRGRRDGGPSSAYNPSISADGRFVAFEAAEGNLNFAKRYGQMGVWVPRPAHAAARVLASRGTPSGKPFSAYNPSLSARRAARRVRDLGVRARRARGLGRGPAHARAADPAPSASRATSTSRRCPPDGALPGLHALGRAASSCTTLERGRAVQVSDGDAWEPVVSTDGSRVAFTRGRRVVVARHGERHRAGGRPARGVDVGVGAVAVRGRARASRSPPAAPPSWTPASTCATWPRARRCSPRARPGRRAAGVRRLRRTRR